MDRRNFLRAGGLLLVGGVAAATAGRVATSALGLHLGFVPGDEGGIEPAPFGGGMPPGKQAALRVALHGCEAIEGGVQVEARLGPEAPWFQLGSAEQRGELACVSPPRRFVAEDDVELRLNGQVLELPLRPGTWVVALGRAPRWEALRLEGGRLVGAEGLAHVVVGVRPA